MVPWLHELSAKAAYVLHEFGPIKTVLASVIAGIGSFFAAKKWLMDLRKWLVEKYDGKILDMLQEARRAAQVSQRPGQHVLYLPFPFQEIVNDAKRSKKAVYGSLRRLEGRGLIHEVRDGWNLGPRPEALTLNNLQSKFTASRWGARPARW